MAQCPNSPPRSLEALQSFLEDDPSGVHSIWDQFTYLFSVHSIWDQFTYLFILTFLSSLCSEIYNSDRPRSWAAWKKAFATVPRWTLAWYIFLQVNDLVMKSLVTLGNIFGILLTWWWAWEVVKRPHVFWDFFAEFRIDDSVKIQGNFTERHVAASKGNLMGPCYGWDFVGICMAAATYFFLDNGWEQPWQVLLGPTYMLSAALKNMKDNKVQFRAGVMYCVSGLLSWYLWVDGFANWMDHDLVRFHRSDNHWHKPTMMLGHYHTFAGFLCLGPGLVMYIQERCKVRTYFQKLMWGFVFFYTLRLHVALAIGVSFGVFRGLPNTSLGCDSEAEEIEAGEAEADEVETEKEFVLKDGSPSPTRRYQQPRRSPDVLYKYRASDDAVRVRRTNFAE